MDGTEDNIIFEKDGDDDDDEVDASNIHPDIPIKESNFKELF